MIDSAATAALDDNRFDELLVEYLEDVISDADGAKLDAALRDSPQRQRQFMQVCLIGQAIAESRDETLMELLAAELVETAAERPPGETWRSAAWEWFIQPMTLGMLVSGIVMTIILLSMALWTVPEWRPGAPVVQQPSTEFVARISKTSRASFDATSDANFENRDLFDDDTIVLNSGMAIIEYDTGARVVLEGPATYHVQGANGADLRNGKLVARVDTEESRGFTVATSVATFIDLGTEFGIEVGPEQHVDGHVFEGLVQIDVADQPSGSQVIQGGESVRITRGAGGKIVVDRKTTEPPRFVREFPEPIILAATEDVWIRRDDRDPNPATAAVLLLSNDREEDPRPTDRSIWLKFDLSKVSGRVTSAALLLDLIEDGIGHSPEHHVRVGIVKDGDPAEDFDASMLNSNSPLWSDDNDEGVNFDKLVGGGPIGDLSVSTAKENTTLVFGDAALLSAIQNDTNGVLTLVIYRTFNAAGVDKFASTKHPIRKGPRLSLMVENK